MTYGEPFNPFKLLTGIHIPEGIVSATNILPGAKLAYGRLLRYAGEDGNCYPAVRTLAKEIGVKERQCQNYLGELESLGLIRRIKRFSERGDRTSNAFEFLWHPLFGAAQHITPPQVQPSPPPVQPDAPTPVHASAHKESHVLRESRFNKNSSRARENALPPKEEKPPKSAEELEREEAEWQATCAALDAKIKASVAARKAQEAEYKFDEEGYRAWEAAQKQA